MLIAFHVAAALSSIVLTAYSIFYPSKARLIVGYGLVAITVATGSYMLFMFPSQMLKTCVTGLVYLAFISAGLIAANLRLHSSKIAS